MTSTIDAAETTLPELLKQVQLGDTIILVSGTSATPTPAPAKVLNPQRVGFLKPLNWPRIPDNVWLTHCQKMNYVYGKMAAQTTH